MKRGRPVCEHCNALNPVKGYRLDPRTWRPAYTLACMRCMRKHGYTPVNHDRPYLGMRASRLM